MPKKPPQTTPVAFREGKLSVTPRPNGTWLFYWKADGLRQRVIGPACTMEQARTLAVRVWQAVLNQAMGLGGMDPAQIIHDAAGREYQDPDAPAVLTVWDALLEAIGKGSRAGVKFRRELALDADLFLKWLERMKSPPAAWQQVNRSMVLDYLTECEQDGLSGSRISGRFKPIRLAARYWAANAPERFRDFTANLRIPAGKPKSAAAPLDAVQAVRFLDRVQESQPALAPIYALALTAGLRIMEAASIRLRDLDLTQGTVTVADTPWHKVKTHASKRTIPVPEYGLALVRRYIAGLDALPIPEGNLFSNRDGRPWKLHALGNAWKRLRGKDGGTRRKDRGSDTLTDLDLPQGFVPSECRATFATLARRSGCDSRLIESCMGHAGRTVLERHYEGVILDDLRRVTEAVQRVLNEAHLSHACPTVKQGHSSSL